LRLTLEPNPDLGLSLHRV